MYINMAKGAFLDFFESIFKILLILSYVSSYMVPWQIYTAHLKQCGRELFSGTFCCVLC